MELQPRGNGPLIATTAIIWGFATGMLAICIPIVALTKSDPILPLALILGASGSTAVVWRNSGERNSKVSELTNSVSKLQHRVVDLETICSSEDFNIHKKFKQLESRD